VERILESCGMRQGGEVVPEIAESTVARKQGREIGGQLSED